MSKIIVILGVGRSGTSLLQAMVSSHPDVAGTVETQLLRKLVLNKYSVWPDSSNDLRQALSGDTNFNRTNVTDKDVEFLYKNSSDYKSFYVNFAEFLLKEQRKTIFCDKDPKLIDFISTISSLGLGIKCLHIYRDPRAVISSRINVQWTRYRNVLVQAVICNAQLNLYTKTRPNSNTLDICYENLISNTSSELKRICGFLSVPFTNEMMVYMSHSASLFSEEEKSWKSGILKPIQGSYTNKYLDRLSPMQIWMTELLSPTAFQIYNYEYMYNGIASKISRAIVKPLLSILNSVYARVIHFK